MSFWAAEESYLTQLLPKLCVCVLHESPLNHPTTIVGREPDKIRFTWEWAPTWAHKPEKSGEHTCHLSLQSAMGSFGRVW